MKIGNGAKILAYGKGEIDINMFNGKEWKQNHLVDVLFVPDIKYNLFSLAKALDKGLKMMSNRKRCTLSREGTIIAVGERQPNNLFRMKMTTLVPEQMKEKKKAVVSTTKEDENIRIWHERLGHQNIQYVQRILSRMGIHAKRDQDFFCKACTLGKMSRKPFQASERSSNEAGDLIHADICGPMEHISIGNSRYFLLLKDDYSHFRRVFFIHSKVQVTECLKEFLSETKRVLNKEVKCLRTDNGLEFVNSKIKEVLKHERSIAYTPEQNGKIERDNRTVVESARTMLHAKGLDLKLWAEAVNTTVFVLNRTGTSSVKGKIPHELWYGELPKLRNLPYMRNLDFKIFGCEAYAHIPKEKKRKWDAKSKEGLFVRYAEHSKGYRIWFSESGKIEVHRDVTFRQGGTQSQEKAGSDLEPAVLKDQEIFSDDDESEAPTGEAEEENADSFHEAEMEQPNQELERENRMMPVRAVQEGRSIANYQLRDRKKLHVPSRYSNYSVH